MLHLTREEDAVRLPIQALEKLRAEWRDASETNVRRLQKAQQAQRDVKSLLAGHFATGMGYNFIAPAS